MGREFVNVGGSGLSRRGRFRAYTQEDVGHIDR